MNNQETVSERIRKDEIDSQWSKFHDAENVRSPKTPEPSPKQKTYLLQLAKTVGITVDLSTIDRKAASQLIDKLKQRAGNGNGHSNNPDIRDKRIAYGMATKLVFKKYLEVSRDPLKYQKFWKDVKAFYDAYQKEQETAVAASSL